MRSCCKRGKREEGTLRQERALADQRFQSSDGPMLPDFDQEMLPSLLPT